MFETIKDLLAYAYQATENMEKKADSFNDERAQQREAFRERVRAAKDELREQVKERTEEAERRVHSCAKDAARGVGVATKDDIDELRTMIEALAAKVDKLSGKKPARASSKGN